MEKMKRACKVCGLVHLGCPFTDCYSEQNDGPMADSLADHYNSKFGKEE